MKIAMFAFLMVVVLTLVEGWLLGERYQQGIAETSTVDGMRLKKDLNNRLVQRDLGNRYRRYIRDINKKHHVHMSNERIPPARVLVRNVYRVYFSQIVYNANVL